MSRVLDLSHSTPNLNPLDNLKPIDANDHLPVISPNLSSVKSSFSIRSPIRVFKNTQANISQESSPQRDISDFSITKPTFKIKRPSNKHRIYQSMDASKNENEAQKKEKNDYDFYRKKLNTPWKQERVNSVDEEPQGIMGRDAIDKFYNHYKKLDKIKDINSYAVISDSMYTNFLSKSESLKLLPAKVGVLRERGAETMLKASHYRIGDKYAQVLSEGIRSVPSYKDFQLSHNRITPKGADNLLPRLQTCAETLDLSENSIGKLGCEHIAKIINHKQSRLVEINLEGNKLGDYALTSVFEAIEINGRLRKLNLGKNMLSDNSAEAIGKMLESNTSLIELVLRWNQIKGPGGLHIIKGLKEAHQLRVLDLSWNSLGCHSNQFATDFAEFIKTNDTLIHLDLSNNYFSKDQAKVIAEALNENHTLYGFHFQGNYGYVDNKGFLQVPEDPEESLAYQHLSVPINGVNPVKESIKKYVDNWGEFKNCCWICEGWRATTFSWNEESGPIHDDPIFLHLSYDGMRNRFLPKNQDFKSDRMIPPYEFTYFFNVQGVPSAAQDQELKDPRAPVLHMLFDDKVEKAEIEKVNFFEGGSQQQVIDPQTFEPLVTIRPRVADEVYVPPEFVEERPQWIFKMGIFRDYKVDTKDILDKCFEADWNNSKILRVVKKEDEIEQVRKMLRDIYPRLKDCYKYNAAENVVSEVWSVQRNKFTAFCETIDIFHSNPKVALSDFDRLFITILTKTDKTKNPRCPDNSMVRHNWLEAWVRLAELKYQVTGQVATIPDALKLVINDHLAPSLDKFNSHTWREKRYFNEDVDTVLKSYLPVLRGVFEAYSGAKTMPGLPPFMSLEEFRKLVTDAELLNEGCAERDVNVSFAYSIMTQVDELSTNRIFEMYKMEFYEALARVIDMYSPAPYGVHDSTMPYKEREQQSLAIKLEGAMDILYNRCCKKTTRDLFIMPEQSIFEMEEVIGKQKGIPKKKKIVRLNPTHPSSHNAYE